MIDSPFMNFDDKDKVQVVAAVLQGPVMIEILKTLPPQQWDQPQEVVKLVASVAAAVMQECKKI